MPSSDSSNLQQETGEALLEVILDLAENHKFNPQGWETLANAYKTTVEGMKTTYQSGSK